MRKNRRPDPDARAFLRRVLGALVVLATLAPARALDPAGWKNRQPLAVDRVGVVKIALPPETLGLARTGLDDVRLLDPAGREVPYVLTTPAPRIWPTTQRPRSIRFSLPGASSQLQIETGTTTPIESVTLESPASGFLKAARVEISSDGATWETLSDRAVIFRQYGHAQMALDLQNRKAAHVRVTVDDSRSAAVPFTGAALALAGDSPPETILPVDARITRRIEFGDESLLTLDLGGAHVAVARLEFVTNEPLFARRITVGAFQFQADTENEISMAEGTIWRVSVDDSAPTGQLAVDARFSAPSRELAVHIHHGDSPPLAIEGVRVYQQPRWLVFRAAEPGTYALLTGHPQCPAPRYDLAALGQALRDTPPSNLTPGRAEPNPGYHAPADALADTPLRGAALDPSPWLFRKAVRLAASGVQQLELDLDVLAHAQSSLSDLRLVAGGAQVPYLVQHPVLSRTIPLTLTAADDPKQPRRSRWAVTLPHAGLPLTQLAFTSSTPLFQRQFRLYEKLTAERGDVLERELGRASWSHSPGDSSRLVFRSQTPAAGAFLPPTTRTFFVETDNGDNPPITLTSAQAGYPVTRLLFKPESRPSSAGPLALYYGNRAAVAPRYDLSLVAGQILAAEKSTATLGAEEATGGGSNAGSALSGPRAGILFWSALALVVIGLLVIVAKLLPKPPANPGP